MDNNNSIPYGSISWDNEDSLNSVNQQREAPRNPPLRPPNSTSSNGLRFSLRGPNFPPPQQRIQGVGISRNSELTNRLPPGETPQSNFQQPSSSSSPPFERYFSLRPSRSASHVQVHSSPQETQTSNSISSNTSVQDETFPTIYSNPIPGSSSSNPAVTSMPQHTNHFSTPSAYIENAYNNNIEMSQGLASGGSNESFHAHKAKRKSSLSESDDGQGGPSSKRFLSEEKMAARMHNLRISSDHNYPVNIMQSFMDRFMTNQLQVAGTSGSQIHEDDDDNNDHDDDEVKNTDVTQNRQDNLPVFVLSSHVKDSIAKPESVIPEAIYNQLSKPCLAVVPWKSPDDRFSFSALESKQGDQDKNDNEPSSSSGSSSACSSLIMESIPETEQLQDKGVHHVEIVGECSTFSFEDEDMEP